MSRAGGRAARAGGAEQPAPPALTDLLCTRCGLCCDGTLLADVQLGSPAEVNRVELLGLALDEDGERPLIVARGKPLEQLVVL